MIFLINIRFKFEFFARKTSWLSLVHILRLYLFLYLMRQVNRPFYMLTKKIYDMALCETRLMPLYCKFFPAV
ncbi:hypothetical protein VNO77_21425 [Canavalia gladiata]|uniref:Uncharacterized protein n=1 Tax=Canavalia gladiata TaxID=3824 RepID=A0AAN9QKA0_CANGL